MSRMAERTEPRVRTSLLGSPHGYGSLFGHDTSVTPRRGVAVQDGPVRGAWALAVAVVLAGCTDDAGPVGEISATSMAAAVPVLFMQLRRADWERDQAIRPLSQPPAVAAVEPSLDWWEQYHRDQPIPGGVEGQDLRVLGASRRPGHAGRRAEVVRHPARRGGRVAGGVRDEPRGEPAAVSIEVSPDYTVMALSYALSLEELTALAESLEPVSADEWLASGGQVVECAPPTADCPSATD